MPASGASSERSNYEKGMEIGGRLGNSKPHARAYRFVGAQTADPGWAADPKTGCRVWDPHPQPRQSISWSGRCIDGFAEGRGIVQWFKDALVFEKDEGEWHEGRQTGKGVQTWPTGRYDGELRNGEPSGHGVLTLGDARYDGEFDRGRPHGVGMLKNSSGTFQGVWRDGCFRG
jgi:MORN repeat protein